MIQDEQNRCDIETLAKGHECLVINSVICKCLLLQPAKPSAGEKRKAERNGNYGGPSKRANTELLTDEDKDRILSMIDEEQVVYFLEVIKHLHLVTTCSETDNIGKGVYLLLYTSHSDCSQYRYVYIHLYTYEICYLCGIGRMAIVSNDKSFMIVKKVITMSIILNTSYLFECNITSNYS